MTDKEDNFEQSREQSMTLCININTNYLYVRDKIKIEMYYYCKIVDTYTFLYDII